MALLSASGAAAAKPPLPDVYLLAGQSNMSGRGALADLTEAERTPDPGIRLYGNDGKARVALDPLDSAEGQIDAVSADPQAAVGPGLGFAREIARHSRRPIVLVPCAKGGSSIARWQPGGGRDTLYGSCLARAREAGGRVHGILWYQGESDAATLAAANAWPEAFAALIARFRDDLGDARLPVVFVQLADPPARPDRALRYPGWRQVQAGQGGVRMKCTAMVAAAGLPRLEDELHLTTAGQRTLGPRLAAAMRRLQRQGCR
ncbi:sialate O-acetylesterase [Sphingomonas parva]|uniref:sialate O-acetylesterase n=1 Tax=Sphingomonas parva TaxID=2555898 RepID=UPI001CDD46C1|nr:sialate O-acetylesterase [Sphingomonas parva]